MMSRRISYVMAESTKHGISWDLTNNAKYLGGKYLLYMSLIVSSERQRDGNLHDGQTAVYIRQSRGRRCGQQLYNNEKRNAVHSKEGAPDKAVHLVASDIHVFTFLAPGMC